MNIEIVTKNLKNEKQVHEFIEQKVHSALDRIDARVSHVTVRLEDQTRNSDAFDGACRIDLTLNPSRHVHVSAHGDSAFDSVLQATRKMEHAAKHDIDRHRRAPRIRHQQTKQKFYSSLSEQSEVDETEPDFNPG